MDDINDPNFEFKYGFNPLKFIAEYLRWWHPTSAANRLQDRIEAASALHQSTISSKIQCGIAEETELRKIIKETGAK